MKIDIRELNRIYVNDRRTKESIKRIIRSNKIRKISKRRRIISRISRIIGFSGFMLMVIAAGSCDTNTLEFFQSILVSLIGLALLGIGVLLHRLLEVTNKNNFWKD